MEQALQFSESRNKSDLHKARDLMTEQIAFVSLNARQQTMTDFFKPIERVFLCMNVVELKM